MNEQHSQEKEYTNGEVTVVWKQHLCAHSANCVKNLASVFKPRERPWINLDNATTPEIKKAVDTCPSGALSYRDNL